MIIPKCIKEIFADFDTKRYAKTELFKIDESSPLQPESKRKLFHSVVQKLLLSHPELAFILTRPSFSRHLELPRLPSRTGESS